MNVLVTLNSAYVPHLLVLLNSMMVSNPDTHFDFYVAHSTLTNGDLDDIKNHVDLTRTAIHPIKVPDALFENAPILKRTSKETYFRLLLTEYLPETVDRILYIDPDTVVINPLDELYNIDFEGNLIAAAGHTGNIIEKLNHARLKMGKNSRYVNAGVMMMDVASLRKIITTNYIFSYIRKNAKRLYLADQDVINGMFWRRIRLIDAHIYNLDEKTVLFHHIDHTSGWIEKNTVIVHFNGSQKPWKEKYRGVLADFYFRYKNIQPKPSGDNYSADSEKRS